VINYSRDALAEVSGHIVSLSRRRTFPPTATPSQRVSPALDETTTCSNYRIVITPHLPVN